MQQEEVQCQISETLAITTKSAPQTANNPPIPLTMAVMQQDNASQASEMTRGSSVMGGCNDQAAAREHGPERI